jgi:zinc protease
MTRRLLALLLLALAIGARTPVITAPGDVVRATLDNGLRVVVVRNTLAPVVAIEINYLAGSDQAPPGMPGMAHAQEHMMFRGSAQLSAAQLSTIMAAMGGDFDADTQQTVTQYFMTVPTEDLETALHIEAIRMQDVLDSDESWQQERGAIEQEVAQDLSDPQYLFYTQVLQHLFGGTPYATDALGTRESFQKTTGAMLRQFHRTWYAPNNAILVVAGDVDTEKTLAAVKRMFGAVPSRPLPPRPAVHPEPLKAATIQLDTDLGYGTAAVAYRMPGFHDPDFAAAQVLGDVLDSARGNLYALGAEGRALSAGFDLTMLPDAGVGAAMAAFPKGDDGQKMIATLKQIVGEYVTKGVPEDLVEAAKRREIAQAVFALNSISGLASEWSDALAVEGRASPDEDLDAIRRVTPADVNRVARKYLINETATLALLVPRASGEAAPGRANRGKESFAPRRTNPVAVPDWAKKTLQVPSLPASNLKPAVMTLANGLRLIVQPERISPTITLVGRIRNNADLQTPPGQEGVSRLLGDLFDYGTQTLDRLAFQAALDQIAADESAGSDFSLQVLSAHFDRGVQLLADNLLRPALPPPAFAIVRQQAASTLEGEVVSPGYRANRALEAALFPKGDPALREATPATVRSLTLGAVRQYYRSAFRPDMTTIVVAGDTTPDQARAIVEKYFGGWRAEGPKPETVLPAVPPNPAAVVDVPDASRVQDQVTLAQTVGINRRHPDYYTLQLANHILAGGFYATRLYRDLRERAGLVYTVAAGLEAGRTRSMYSVVYACDPPNVGKARAMVVRDLTEMQQAVVPAAELDRAKTLLLRQIPLSESSVGAIAEGLLGRAVEELPLDEPIVAAKQYLAITPDQVRAAFARWIRPAGFVQVTLGPAPK